MWATLLALVLGGVVLFAFRDEAPKTQYFKHQGFVFGTYYNIRYSSTESREEAILKRLDEFDKSLSTFNPHSTISVLNQGRDTVWDADFTEMYQCAQEINRLSHGAFDITVAPLVNAWGFGFKNGLNPDDKTIDSLRQVVGFQKIRLENDKIVKLDPRVMLDCSAIAKGYGVDVVANLLRDFGIKNFMVEIGGEVVTSGVNPDRQPWRIGVTKPTDDSLSVNNELQTVINVTDKAMATSGNYRNFYYKGGRKYAHTIDPKTGYPVQHSILSATVITNDCATADAYATSFMVLGMEDAKKVLNRHPEMMAYFIYSDEHGQNQVWFSPSLKDKIAQ